MKENLESWVVGATMDKLRPGWRERAAAQRSWWKMIEIYLTIILLCGMWLYVAPWVSGKIHAHFHPRDAMNIPNPFRASMTFWTLCAIIPIAGPLFCLAGIIVNSVESLFKFTRIKAEKGSEIYPELTLKGANGELARWMAWMCLIAVPLYFLGSVGPWTLPILH